jgi:hypothetical protein
VDGAGGEALGEVFGEDLGHPDNLPRAVWHRIAGLGGIGVGRAVRCVPAAGVDGVLPMPVPGTLMPAQPRMIPREAAGAWWAAPPRQAGPAEGASR